MYKRQAEDMAEALGLPGPLTKGSVVASDAFFPFPDGLLTAAEAGAVAVIQPGGSMNAVSYTHLDVYKRQSFTSLRRRRCFCRGAGLMPPRACRGSRR